MERVLIASWRTQLVVDSLKLGGEISSVDLAKKVRVHRKNIGKIVGKMNCVTKTHNGSQGGGYERDVSIYKRTSPPGPSCDGCWFNQNRNSACYINLNMRNAQISTLQPKSIDRAVRNPGYSSSEPML